MKDCWADWGRAAGVHVMRFLVLATSSARSRFSLQVLVGTLAVARMLLRCLSLYFMRSSVVVLGVQMVWQMRQTRSLLVVAEMVTW